MNAISPIYGLTLFLGVGIGALCVAAHALLTSTTLPGTVAKASACMVGAALGGLAIAFLCIRLLPRVIDGRFRGHAVFPACQT